MLPRPLRCRRLVHCLRAIHTGLEALAAHLQEQRAPPRGGESGWSARRLLHPPRPPPPLSWPTPRGSCTVHLPQARLMGCCGGAEPSHQYHPQAFWVSGSCPPRRLGSASWWMGSWPGGALLGVGGSHPGTPHWAAAIPAYLRWQPGRPGMWGSRPPRIRVMSSAQRGPGTGLLWCVLWVGGFG